jgi:hypothetical protein
MFTATTARALIESLKGLDARAMLQIGSANQVPLAEQDLMRISRLLEKQRDEHAANQTFMLLATSIVANSYNEEN